MTTVKKGDVFIANYCGHIHETNEPVKSLYFIDKIRNEEIEVVDAMVITFWKYSLPTLYYTKGPMSEILAPPLMGSMEQGTLSDWFAALNSAFAKVDEYSRKIVREVKE